MLRSYSADVLTLSALFMKLWYFETLHCQNFITHRQKCHDVTNDVKDLRVGCMKNMLFLANILFISLSMCAMEFAEKLTPIHFCFKLA